MTKLLFVSMLLIIYGSVRAQSFVYFRTEPIELSSLAKEIKVFSGDRLVKTRAFEGKDSVEFKIIVDQLYFGFEGKEVVLEVEQIRILEIGSDVDFVKKPSCRVIYLPDQVRKTLRNTESVDSQEGRYKPLFVEAIIEDSDKYLQKVDILFKIRESSL